MTTKALAATAFVLWLAVGFALQAKWDANCAQQQPGTHWNGDEWRCKP